VASTLSGAVLRGDEREHISGLTWTTTTSGHDSGPTLAGAKLNRAGGHAEGERGVRVMDRFGYLPNDEFALYGKDFAPVRQDGLPATR
jgi:hypothetical protein